MILKTYLTSALLVLAAVFAMPSDASPGTQCTTCSREEKAVLKFFQNQGVTDEKAQAVILGAIKQESKFKAQICEGGKITTYRGCNRGYGLIQWTYPSRYYGLGTYAARTNQKPESIYTQLEYIVTEPEWNSVASTFKTPGLSMNSYSNAEHRWVGAGIRGPRLSYAYDYLAMLNT